MSLAVPFTSQESVDHGRSEALAQSHIVEPSPELSRRYFSPDVEVDASSRLTRIGHVASRIMRAAGLVSLAVGSYGIATNVQEVYKSKDAIIEDIGELDSTRLDRAASNLLTGKFNNAEADGKTAQQGFQAITRTIDQGVDDMIISGHKAGEGVQDLAMGSALAVTGQIGTSLFKRRHKQQVSYLQTDFMAMGKLFEPPSKPHISRLDTSDNSPPVTLRQIRHHGDRFHRATYLYEKFYAVAVGAVLLSGLGVSANIAEAADDSITKTIDKTVLDDIQQPMFEGAAERFKASVEDDIRAAVEAEIPRTMAAVESDKNAKKLFEASSESLQDTSEEQLTKLADIEAGPTFFTRMRDRLNDVYHDVQDNGIFAVSVLAAGLILIVSKLQPDFMGTGKARVSQKFLQNHLGKSTDK